jgi:hypothetical protein
MGSQKLIQDQQKIEEILSTAKFLRLALSDTKTPYIVPMAFGYKENALYLHSSRKAGKSRSLKRIPGSVSKPPSKPKLSPPTFLEDSESVKFPLPGFS